jgi:hypothetical protein
LLGIFYADPAQSLAKWTRVIATSGFIFLALHLLLRMAVRFIPMGNNENSLDRRGEGANDTL